MRRMLAAVLALLFLFADCARAAPFPEDEPPAAPARPEGYARSLLDGEGRAAYDEMCSAAEGWRVGEEIPLASPASARTMRAAYDALLLDRAEFYWLRCEIPAGERADRFTLTVEEGLTLPAVRERQRQIDAAADALLDGMEGLPAPEAAVRAHDALLRRVSYEEGAQGGDAGNLYGGLVRGGGVCGAYSRAYQYLMQRLGVPCAFLSGTSVRGIPHAWNAVKLEDGWYYVDATWDDLPDETGYLYHDYLLVTLEEISLEHFPEPGQYRELPPGDSDRYSYYRQFGYCADLGDPDPVAAMAAGFARRLADQPLPAARQPVFLEIKLFGEYEAFTRWRDIYHRDIFPLLRAVSARLEEENIPVEIDTTGYIEYNYNDNTQVLTLFPNASASV